MSSSENWPQYRCHKVVRAAKILTINRLAGEATNVVQLDLDGNVGIDTLGDAFVGKHAPEAGGYLVRYEDGYVSYSPAAAFEGGYNIIAKTSRADD